jgi:hypothetical protein
MEVNVLLQNSQTGRSTTGTVFQRGTIPTIIQKLYESTAVTRHNTMSVVTNKTGCYISVPLHTCQDKKEVTETTSADYLYELEQSDSDFVQK